MSEPTLFDAGTDLTPLKRPIEDVHGLARFGDQPPTTRQHGSLEERLWRNVDRRGADGCWFWTAGVDRHGYGRIGLGGRGAGTSFVHRVAYELLIGPIPEGLVIDHLCRVPRCVNPAHLEPVTLAENKRRGESFAARNARKTHCDYGHEFTPENTYSVYGWRRCRTCKRERDRRYYRQKLSVRA